MRQLADLKLSTHDEGAERRRPLPVLACEIALSVARQKYCAYPWGHTSQVPASNSGRCGLQYLQSQGRQAVHRHPAGLCSLNLLHPQYLTSSYLPLCVPEGEPRCPYECVLPQGL